VVHEGGKASGFKNRADVDSYDTDGISLYHIKGTNEMNTRGVQVEEKAHSLNSGDCFALLTPRVIYIWQGKGSNATERKTAQGIAGVLKGARTVTPVEEGKEPAEFWTALGGKTEYPNEKELGVERKEPRLFHCSSNAGHFHVEEIFNFTQDDLIDDDVMILDTYGDVFVWVGNKSTKEEKDTAMKTAMDFVGKSPDGRSPDTPIYKVSPGGEPPNFTCHFLGWNPAKRADDDPYQARLASLKGTTGPVGKVETKGASGATSPKAETKAAPAKVERVTASSIGYAPFTTSFPLQTIKDGLAPNIDPGNKHLYLSDTDFMTQFKMNKEAFGKLAKWKADQEKKRVGLF
jgi:villin 1/advillin